MTAAVFELATMVALETIRGEVRSAMAQGELTPQIAAGVVARTNALERELKAAIDCARQAELEVIFA